MRYLLDTSVISEPLKPRPEPKVRRWFDTHDRSVLFISAMTIGEIHNGIHRLAAGARRDALMNWVDSELPRLFEGRVLPIDHEVAAEWGRLAGRSAAQGRPLPVVDSLIAATAIVHHLTVVTRDAGDMERCGAPVSNPWD